MTSQTSRFISTAHSRLSSHFLISPFAQLLGISNFPCPKLNSCSPAYSPTHFYRQHAPLVLISLSVHGFPVLQVLSHPLLHHHETGDAIRSRTNDFSSSYIHPPTILSIGRFYVETSWQESLGIVAQSFQTHGTQRRVQKPKRGAEHLWTLSATA